MQKKEKKHVGRVRNLITICVLIAVVLSASTYAWFIGMRTVNVSSFDVTIASTDSLLLSLDGEHWSYEVSISEGTMDEVSYVGHTNSWGNPGLVPMSSVGGMDVNTSRMILFEKASLTATSGGYRIMSSRVENSGATEAPGYVVFDLFVKNFTGKQYIDDYNLLDEEAVYLTTDSEVTVSKNGGVANTGIENSVRVAFAQVGRVSGNISSATTITGITCTPLDGEGKPTIVGDVTGICKTAQIWEPNDHTHVQNAINWYNASCRARTGAVVYEESSYSGSCQILTVDGTYPTYPIGAKIDSNHNVDIYDGEAYNGYTGSSAYAISYDTFTDTERDSEGLERPTFMTLAPNSITKVRIYVYLEGQDIDNYDFASIGRKISVQFGFTKERFDEDDVDYVGPSLDQEAPVISLIGNNPFTVPLHGTYSEPGYTAYDNFDSNMTSDVIVDSSQVNTEVAGTYEVTYNVTDAHGNAAEQKIRTVIVQE